LSDGFNRHIEALVRLLEDLFRHLEAISDGRKLLLSGDEMLLYADEMLLYAVKADLSINTLILYFRKCVLMFFRKNNYTVNLKYD
jgi:hypothetical protein